MFRELKKFLVLLLAGVCIALPAHAKRLALVLGNDQYTTVSKLQKAGNDATAMARELRAAGFTVQLHKDLNYRGMVKAIEVFAANISGGDEVVVFFAGHGVQIKAGSYLLPTDIEATNESEVEKTAYELNALIDKISEAKPAFSLIVVDACRNNPLKSKGRSVGATRGLSAVEPPKGQMVVFSASRGQEALDRLSDKDPNPNGVFTREFIKRMKKPGVRIEDLMREVQDAVEQLADSISHEQRPAIYNESRGNFYFFGPTSVQISNSTVPLVSTQTKDENFWEDVKAAGNKEAYEAYLLSYPTGRYAHLAKANIIRLTTSNSAPAPAPAPASVPTHVPDNKLTASQTKWDLPAAYPSTNFHSVNMAQFATDVDKATAGKLKITVHANASLFKAPEIKRAVQGGQTQLGEILLINFQNEWQPFGADGLPFLADSYNESMKLYKAQKPLLEKKLAEQGMMLLYTVAWPPQGIYSKKPINSAADLKGIKWRAYSPTTAKIAELVGAQPVTVQAAEFSQALAKGVVESTMTSGATGVDSKLYEHLKYYYDVQAWLPKNAVIANKKAFDALDKPTQDALLKAASEAETRGWAESRKVNTTTMETLKANGMTIAAPSAQLKADMKKVGDTIMKEWLEKSGTEGKVIVDAFKR